jgi:hypothetical protein
VTALVTLSRPIITIFPGPDGWLARFHDDPRIMELFDGTDTLPTSYTMLEPGERVRAKVQQLNPGHQVRLVHKDGSLYEPEG